MRVQVHDQDLYKTSLPKSHDVSPSPSMKPDFVNGGPSMVRVSR